MGEDDKITSDWQRQQQIERVQREQDGLTLLIAGLALLFLGGGGAFAWEFLGYLNNGLWPNYTLRSVTGWTFTSEMAGWQNIVNWFLDLWIGFYPAGLGALFIWSAPKDF